MRSPSFRFISLISAAVALLTTMVASAGAEVAAAASLAEAVASGDIKRVEAALDDGALVRMAGEGGQSVLHLAASKSASNAIIAALLDAGARLEARDGKRRTPLLAAALAGNNAAAALLMDRGADPGARDAAGASAAELARAAGHAGVADAIQQFARRFEKGSPGVREVAVGAALAAAVRDAKDGAVLVLSSGRYTGGISVTGKSIVIRGDPRGGTVLAVSDRQAAVYAGQGAQVTLEHIRIEPTVKTVFGLFADGGTVRLRDCHLIRAPQIGAVAQKSGRIELDRCRIEGSQRPAIQVAGGSALIASMTDFAACPRAVLADGASHIGLFDCRFDGSAEPLNTRGWQTAVHVVGSTFLMPPSQKPAAQAIAIAGARRITIADCRFLNADTALIIAGDVANPAHVNGNVAINAQTAYRFNATGLAGPPDAPDAPDAPDTIDRLSLRMAGNVAINASQYGIAVVGGPHTIDVRDSLIITPAGAGIGLDQSTGSLTGNTIIAPLGAMILQSPRPLSLRATRHLGAIVPASAPVTADEPTRRFDTLARLPAESAALRAAAEALRIKALAAKDAADIDALVLAARRVDESVAALQQKAGSFVRVQLQGTDLAGTSIAVPFRAIVDLGKAPGDPTVAPEDVVDPAALIKQAAQAGGAGDVIRPLLDEAARARLTTLGDGDPSPLVEPVIAALNRALEQQDLREKAIAAGAAISRATRGLVIEGNLPAAERREQLREVNRRVLEDCLPGLIRPTAALAISAGDNHDVFLPPGRYWLVAGDHPELTTRVEVAAGEAKRFERFFNDQLWLRYRVEGRQVHRLAGLQWLDERRRTLHMQPDVPASMDIAMPLPGATAPVRGEALRLARAGLPGVIVPAPVNGTGNESRRARDSFEMKRAAVRRILRCIGEAEDAAAIVRLIDSLPLPMALPWMEIAASLEARLGQLEEGAVQQAMMRGSPSAAILLTQRGGAGGQARLLALLREDPQAVAAVASALRRSDDPIVIDAMRAALASCIAQQRTPPPALVHYLLVQGDRTDLARISRQVFDADTVASLLPYFDEHRHLIRDIWSAGRPGLRQAMPIFVAQGRDEAERFDSAVTSRIYHARGGESNNAEAMKWVNGWRHDISFCRPHPVMSVLLYQRNENIDAPWAPMPWRPLLKPRRGSAIIPSQAYLSSEGLDAALEHSGAADWYAPDALELHRAAHRVSTRAFLPPDFEPLTDAIRRPFALQHPGSLGGAVSGFIELRPVLTDRLLTCTIRVNQRPTYAGENSKVWDHVKNGGRGLISAVTLYRKGERITLNERGRNEDGHWVFEGDAGSADPSGMCVVIGLTFFDQSYEMVAELSDSGHARTLRRARAQIAPAAAALAASPNDVDAAVGLARAQTSANRYADALATWESLLKREGRRPELWREAVMVFAGAKQFERAASLLKGAVAQFPDEVAWRAWLAGSLLVAGRHTEAADAAAQALRLAPKDMQLRYTHAAALLLAGDHQAALKAAESTSANSALSTWPVRAATLTYLAAIIGGSDTAPARAALLAAAAKSKNPLERHATTVLLGPGDPSAAIETAATPAQRCRLFALAGFRALAERDTSRARSMFQGAVATGEREQLEYLLAQQQLVKLEQQP